MNFKEYAQYYNLLYKEKDYKGEVDYILKLFSEYSEMPIKKVLDLGCGTGNHDLILAENDINVVGVDLSNDMIEIAKSKIPELLKDSINYNIGDVRNIDLHKSFDAVISLFHVASYQTTYDDLSNYFNTAFKHLKEGGVFVFDFWHGTAVLQDKPTIRIKRIEDDEIEVLRIGEPLVDHSLNTIDVNFEIHVKSKKTNGLSVHQENHKMKYWFLPELKHWLEQAGFKLEACLNWMDFDDLKEDSWYGLIVAKK